MEKGCKVEREKKDKGILEPVGWSRDWSNGAGLTGNRLLEGVIPPCS